MPEIERHTGFEIVNNPDISVDDRDWVRYSDHRTTLVTELERLAEEFEQRATDDGLLVPIQGTWKHAASRLRERATEYRQKVAKGDGIPDPKLTREEAVEEYIEAMREARVTPALAALNTDPEPPEDCDDLCVCGEVRHEHRYFPDPECGPETGGCAHCNCERFTEPPRYTEEIANLRACATNVIHAWDNPSPGPEKWDRLRQKIEYLREAIRP